MAEADLGKTFSQAFNCAKSLKRMAPFFIVNIVYLVALVLMLGSLLAFLSAALIAGAAALLTLFTAGLALLGFLVIMAFINLYLQAGVMDNAYSFWQKKEISFGKSLQNARPRYLSLLGATILYTIIVMLVNLIPFVGWIIGLVLSWGFIVYAPAAVIGKKGAVDSLKDSWAIFSAQKLNTFLFWLLLMIIGGVLFMLAFIPVFIAALPALAAIYTGGVLAAIQANVTALFVGGVITAFLLSFVTVFMQSALTFYYAQAKKK